MISDISDHLTCSLVGCVVTSGHYQIGQNTDDPGAWREAYVARGMGTMTTETAASHIRPLITCFDHCSFITLVAHSYRGQTPTTFGDWLGFRRAAVTEAFATGSTVVLCFLVFKRFIAFMTVLWKARNTSPLCSRSRFE